MQAEKHPDFQQEDQRLKGTQQAIQDFLENKSRVKVSGGDDWATDNLALFNLRRRMIYEQSQENPYFAHVDFEEVGHKMDHHYFGYKALNLDDYEVIEWRAPLGRLLASSSSEQQTLRVPGGKVTGSLLLRRRFRIKDRQLQEISDEFDRRPGMEHQVEHVNSQQFLLEELYSRGDPRLSDIVKTIQKQQDDIIRAPHDQVILLNGVAGSGKTSIALHRLAYLLFPDNQTQIRAHRTIVFCPNRIFLRYIEDLLPGLGEKDVQQTTFYDWVLAHMRLTGKIKLVDTLQDMMLNTQSVQSVLTRLWQRARFKGRARIKLLLNRYTLLLQHQLIPPERGWLYPNLGDLNLSLGFSKQEIQQVLQEVFKAPLPFAEQRDRAWGLLRSQLASKYDEAIYSAAGRLSNQAENLLDQASTQRSPERAQQLRDQARLKQREAETLRTRAFAINTTKQRIVRQAETLLQADFNTFWPPVSAVDLYYQLLSDRSLLAQAGFQEFGREELDLLQQPRPPLDQLEYEDIAAVFYLYQKLFGEVHENYEHIVLDEAQDFSPLQFEIIRQNSQNGSITIVGDLAQSIHAFRGLSSWEEILPIFTGDRVVQENIIQSYRSTREIVQYSNGILKKLLKEKAILSEPFARSGEKPVLYKAPDKASLRKTLVERIQFFQSEYGYQNIAVIVKNRTEAWEMITTLERQGCPPVIKLEEVTSEFKYQGGLVVLPVNLTKGLEFEAVILYNPSEEMYNSTHEYDGRLLYVAVTRALHALEIIYTGKLSAYLPKTAALSDSSG